MQQIDFSSSYLIWLTKKEGSYGRFQLDAACTIRDFSRKKTSTYYLASAVIAGNVYAKNDLVKQPVYLFQIAASDERHVIFRTFASHVDDQNSINKNSDLFAGVEFHITRKEFFVLKDFDDIDFHFQQCNSISAHVSYGLGKDCQIEIEFPIKHINIQKERRLFQIETGPILIPSEPLADRLSAMQGYSFDTAFVHFNRLDSAEFILNAPTCVGQETICFFSQVKKLNARIVLMADKDKNPNDY